MANKPNTSEEPSSSTLKFESVDLQNATKEKRLREFYETLDVDGDGLVDVKDLTAGLKKLMPHDNRYHDFAKQIMEEADTTKDKNIDFKEFVNYVLEHEKKLAIVFKNFDKNADGVIDVSEVKQYLGELGLPTTDEEAEKILKKMHINGKATIDLDAFQEYFMLCPGTDPLDFARLWRHSLIIDIGEDTIVPDDFTDKELESGTWWRHLIAGGVAGAVSRTCTAPLDRLKVYLQVHASKQNGLRVLTCAKFLLKEGGWRSLWRGNGINVFKIAPESALKFTFYEHIKKRIKSLHGQELSIAERFIAGSSAGALSQTIIYPMEVLKTRLALRKTGELNKGALNAAISIFKLEGGKAFFRGFLPNLIGIIPYAGIDLAVYETLKKWYVASHPHQEPTMFAFLICGTMSSICGQFVSYPLALVRTKLQAHAYVTPAVAQPNTMVGQFQYIVKNEGFPGLYRGLTPNFMKVLPAVGISYMVYETVRKRLGVDMS